MTAAVPATTGFELHRLGTVMEPEPGNPREVEGVLNPAAVRGPDGELYLFRSHGFRLPPVSRRR
jgi:hypothetical protein